MLLFNVCSLKKINSSNKKACSLLGQDLDSLNIDVAVITETFLRPSVPDSFVGIPGYKILRRDRSSCSCRHPNCHLSHKGGGVLVYCRSSYDMELYDSSTLTESMWVKIYFSNNSPPLFLNATYHPPNGDKDAALTYLLQSASEIMNTHPKSSVIIAGDFNKLNLGNLEIDLSLTLLDSPPTRLDAKLDQFMINRPHLVESTHTFTSTLPSDHLALILKPVNRTPVIRRKVTFTDFCRKGFRTMSHLLESKNYEHLFRFAEVDDAAEWLDYTVKSLATEAFPQRQVLMSDRDPAWLTPRAKWLLLRKKKALRKHRTSNQLNLRQAEMIDEKLYRLKLQYHQKNKTKELWKDVDSSTNRKLNKKVINESAFNGNELNNALANRCSTQDQHQSNSLDFVISDLDEPQLSMVEVANTLQNCKKSAVGPSEIPSLVFKEFWCQLTPLYHYVWNFSLKTCTFPSCYKLANISAVPKTAIAKKVDDIRGISVTSISARLFERAVHRKWILPNLILYSDPMQFAYKPQLSTADCLLTLEHYVLNHLDNANIDGVHLLLIDFSKAFDTIDHEIAGNTFSKFITSGNLCQWLYSFLKGRKQRLIWKTKPLEYQCISLGCSQGTVGGPNVFSMVTDDIRAISSPATIIKYSDDMNLLVPCYRNPSGTQKRTFKEEIQHLNEATEVKRMTINNNKTKSMRFCLNHQPLCECHVNDLPYNSTSQAQILGVTFQSNFLFTNHCKSLIRCLKRNLYTLRDLKLKNYPSTDINKIFDALILSRIRYCISVYGSDNDAIRKIDMFLKRCHEKGYSNQEHSATSILQSEDHRILRNILSNPHHPLWPFLHTNPQTRHTRHRITQLKPITRTVIFHNSFINRIRPF